jgi:hypothetical protein
MSLLKVVKKCNHENIWYKKWKGGQIKGLQFCVYTSDLQFCIAFSVNGNKWFDVYWVCILEQEDYVNDRWELQECWLKCLNTILLMMVKVWKKNE